MANLETQYVGLTLKTPIVVASAGITETVERMRRAQDNGAGAVVMKSLFEKELSRTSPAPRFKVLHHDLGRDKTFTLMSYEQASEWGPERYGEEIANAKATLELKVIPSINCYTDEGWVCYAQMMEAAGADALELNVSCPHGSITFTGVDVENTIFHTVEIVRKAVSLPIIPKISPMLTAPLNVVKRVVDLGANGVTIFNRMTAIEIDIYEQRPTMPGGYAGHGGPWAIQYPLRWITAIRPQVDVDIAGSGGVSEWRDVVKHLLAGATVVQTCTAVVMNGYGVISEFVRGLERYMDEWGYETVDAFRGIVCDRILDTEEIPREHLRVAEIAPNWAAPCKAACPMHVPAQSYVRLIAERRFADAYRLIREKDPFQSVCGYVCYRPCEDACTRGEIDEPIAIRALKRFVLEWGDRHPEEVEIEIERATESGRKVAVVGGGPAGLTAAYDLARAGHMVTVFEALPKAGGMLAAGVPKYRLPEEVLDEEIARVERMGVTIRTNARVGTDPTLDDLRRNFDAVLLAIGAHDSSRLGVPGEDAEGVVHGIDFLHEVDLNGSAKVGARVAVVGGGNTAIDAARTALRLGAREVYLVYRRTREEMPADDGEIREAEEEGVRILYLVAPTEVLAEDGRVIGLRCVNLFLGDPDEGGRRRPNAVEGTEFVLTCDTVIPAVSQLPDLTVLSGTSGGSGSNVVVNAETRMTSVPGVFAAGDAVSGRGSVIEAVASGRRAAYEMDRYLRGGEPVLKPEPEVVSVDKREVIRRNADETPEARIEPGIRAADERTRDFRPIEASFTEEQAVEEAKRCLACGCGVGCDVCSDVCIYDAVQVQGDRYFIDKEKCDGCGLCPERCPNGVISMVELQNADCGLRIAE